MNTKHKRIVVTLFVVLTALATTGFTAVGEGRHTRSITADHLTCPVTASPSIYLSLLSSSEEHCLSTLIDQIETEIDRGLSRATSTRALLESIYTRSRSTGSVEYLALLETDAFAGPSSLSSVARQVSRTRLSGPSATDVPLISVYTNATARDVATLDATRAVSSRSVGFDGPSATDVPLESVYTHNRH